MGRRRIHPEHPTCECGKPMSAYAARCIVCERAARRPSDFQCEHCGPRFWRKMRGDSKKDAKRFCSRDCSFAFRKARKVISRVKRRISRRKQQRCQLCELCRLPLGITDARRYAHSACQYELQKSRVRVRRFKNLAATKPILDHVCPACGQSFLPQHRNSVYCTSRCAKQALGKGIGPGLLRYVPLSERNQLAAMWAEVKAVRRILGGFADVGG
jgi:hypothetical protein